jgi:hypothetical protein
MKHQKSCGPRLGKLVHQLPGVVSFAYDLRFRHVIARWKGIIEKIQFRHNIKETSVLKIHFPKKHRLGPQNDPGSLGPEKLKTK